MDKLERAGCASEMTLPDPCNTAVLCLPNGRTAVAHVCKGWPARVTGKGQFSSRQGWWSAMTLPGSCITSALCLAGITLCPAAVNCLFNTLITTSLGTRAAVSCTKITYSNNKLSNCCDRLQSTSHNKFSCNKDGITTTLNKTLLSILRLSLAKLSKCCAIFSIRE